MSEEDFNIVCHKIDQEKEFLNSISQDIWNKPEVQPEEVNAHAVLTCALSKYGFKVQKHYFLNTAFRAEYVSKSGGGDTVAIILEYDALPEIGHGCGHNLIAEAGLAASLAIKTVMENDPKLPGKLLVLGTPSEEAGGGKIRLIEHGAFKDIDVAMMVHPTKITSSSPETTCIIEGYVEYKGKEAHAAASPWEGRNALDAAISCYNSISYLRQHIKPTWRVNAIITKGGAIPNIIPAQTLLELYVRGPTFEEVKDLQSRIEDCVTSAAAATGCEVNYHFDDLNCYKNLISNKVLGSLFQTYGERFGLDFNPERNQGMSAVSTDMGNVSYEVPSIQPFFSISSETANHTKEFAKVAGSPSAQEPTLAAAKAMALTALKVLRCPETLNEVKRQFQIDLHKAFHGK